MRSLSLALLAAALAGCATTPSSTLTTVRGPAAAAAFERFKSLNGDWESKSTQGWQDRTVYRTIASGSVVMESEFEGQPQQMASMISLDGDRLLLTHYCAAKNQPRLVASRISPDGREVEFAFLDGTGMASRNTGHMDRAVYRFADADHFTARWTWYQDGKEKWGEEVEYRRAAPK